MSGEIIVRSCSPTLAGIKTGSLFSCSFDNEEQLKQDIRSLNHKLFSKGIRVVPLRISNQKVLVYMYRPSRLHADLLDEHASRLLKSLGYSGQTDERKIIELMNRLNSSESFPHEIGLFLGYPPEDVEGFILNKAQNFKLIGTWKVYGDERNAKNLFEKYNKCTKTYCSRYSQGLSIEQLAIAI